eukprot:scaffold119562_cov45-Prasinocladus_malaysianus.AAC.1
MACCFADRLRGLHIERVNVVSRPLLASYLSHLPPALTMHSQRTRLSLGTHACASKGTCPGNTFVLLLDVDTTGSGGLVAGQIRANCPSSHNIAIEARNYGRTPLQGEMHKTNHDRATSERVQVVILCGSFGQSLVADLHHRLSSTEDTTKIRLYKAMLRECSGGHFVTDALQNVHKAAALYHTVSAMQSARRLQPLDQNVFFVCNEANL